MKKKNYFLMLTCLIVGLAGCGQSDDVTGNIGSGIDSEYLYVPDFFSPGVDLDSMCVDGNMIYYSTVEGAIYRWKPEEQSAPELVVEQTFDVKLYELERGILQADTEGNLYFICDVREKETEAAEDGEENQAEDAMDIEAGEDVILAKYNAAGTLLYREEIAEYFPGFTVRQVAVDGEGHIYLLGGEKLTLFSADGVYEGEILSAENESIDSITVDENGTVYCYSNAFSAGRREGNIREVSYEKGLSEMCCQKVSGGNELFASTGEDFLLSPYGSLYIYKRAEQNQELLTEWVNCDIERSLLRRFCVLKDGRIVALLQEDSGAAREIAVLTRMERAQIQQKKTLILGVFQTNTSMLSAVVRFNRSNSEYRVEVRQYYDAYLSGTQEAAEEARTALNLDIVSGRCPDILNLDYDDLEKYASKGLLEDLIPYLKKSDRQLMSNVTESYTFQGKLVSLPGVLRVRTIVGSKSELGEIESWSLEEMMNFIDSHQGDIIFMADARKMLEYFLTFNQSSFVDWKKHTCNFNSEEFRQVLELCNRFSGQENFPVINVLGQVTGKQNNALLHEVEVSRADDFSILTQLYGEDIVFVGFPTIDGSQGNILEAGEGSYSISSKSAYKEAAWSFINLLLGEMPKTGFGMNSGFPADRDTRDQFFSNIMEEPYILTEEGEPVLEADDEPKRRELFSVVNDFVRIKYYVPVAEEVEPIQKLLEASTADRTNDKQILSIIQEEASYYFDGKKSLEEVMEIIQNRVHSYVEEQ